MKRAMYACQLNASPAILEPMFLCDITVPQQALNGVYTTLNARRGIVDCQEDRPGTPLCKVKAFVPVLESFGFTGFLRQNTGGQAFPQMIFSHWREVEGNPMEPGNMANGIIVKVRARKGLKEALPKFN